MANDNRQEYNFKAIATNTDTEEVAFTYEVNAAPLNLVGAAIVIKFKKWNEPNKIQKTLSVGSGITITNGVAGIFKVDSFRMDWKPGTYLYDIDVTPSGGVKKNWVKGSWVITENI